MTALLDASGITKAFAGVRAINEVSVMVDRGERVGLIGPNGAGKTTLFNCILGVIRPDAGRVVLDGNDISSIAVHERARLGIGRTFQRIELFLETTVRDHLLVAERVRQGHGSVWRDLLGRGRPSRDELAATDRMLELLGLVTLADEPIEQLSLGQGRLVEVARALMTRPSLLLLDEPSSGLDGSETTDLAATLRAVQSESGFAMLLVEHDVELVSTFTDRCYVLDFGKLIAAGPTAATLADPHVRAAYFGTTPEAS